MKDGPIVLFANLCIKASAVLGEPASFDVAEVPRELKLERLKKNPLLLVAQRQPFRRIKHFSQPLLFVFLLPRRFFYMQRAAYAFSYQVIRKRE